MQDTPLNPSELVSYEVAAGAVVRQGRMAAMGTDGYLVEAADASGLVAMGRIESGADNTDGADGEAQAQVRRGAAFAWQNDALNPVAKAQLGRAVYVKDSRTVSSDPGSNSIVAGICVQLDGGRVWVEPVAGGVVGGGADPFSLTPLNLDDVPDLLAYYDPTDPSTWALENTNRVAGVANKVNPGTYDLSATGSLRPTLVTSDMGGLPALYFDGTNALSLAENLDLGSNHTIVMLIKPTNTTSNLRVWGGSSSNNFQAIGSTWGLKAGNQTISVDRHVVVEPVIISVRRAGPELNFYIDGRSRTPNSNAITTESQIFNTLGGSAARFEGFVYGLGIYSRELSDTELARVEAGLAQRFRLGEEMLPTVVFDGNSIFAGVGTTNASSAVPSADTARTDIPSRVRQALGWPDTKWFNYAVSGQTTTMMMRDAASQIDELASPFRPDNILLVWEGTNHLAKSPPYPVGGATINAHPTKEEVYNTLVAYCEDRRKNWKVVVIGVLPRTPGAIPDRKDEADFEAKRNEINTWLAANWPNFADAYVDLSTVPGVFAEGDNLGGFYDALDIHPNDDGALAIAGAIAPVVASVRKKAVA